MYSQQYQSFKGWIKGILYNRQRPDIKRKAVRQMLWRVSGSLFEYSVEVMCCIKATFHHQSSHRGTAL